MNTKRTKKLSQPQNNAKDVFAEVEGVMSKEKKAYLKKRFVGCQPKARKISEEYTETVWTDAMKIMQDFPSEYTKQAAICFFAFMGTIIDAYLEKRYKNGIKAIDLPVIMPVAVKSEMVKMLLERGEKEMNKEGQELLENLLQRDFGFVFAIIKALNIENDELHNLLISGFRFWVWEVMIPHLFASEKKGEENAATC